MRAKFFFSLMNFRGLKKGSDLVCVNLCGDNFSIETRIFVNYLSSIRHLIIDDPLVPNN